MKIMGRVELKTIIDDEKVIPKQDLEGMFANLAVIRKIYSCDNPSENVREPFKDSDIAYVEVNDVIYEDGSSSLVMNKRNYDKLEKAYGADNYKDLCGKKVLAIYSRNAQQIEGFVPIVD